jgi:hypothetical protein
MAAGFPTPRILKGVTPADLPVEQAGAWKLTVNLPASTMLARGGEAIE